MSERALMEVSLSETVTCLFVFLFALFFVFLPNALKVQRSISWLKASLLFSFVLQQEAVKQRHSFLDRRRVAWTIDCARLLH